MQISNNIRHLRHMRNYSQEQLAQHLKISRARIGAYEEGRSEPPIELLIAISDYFHLSIDALVRGDLSKTEPDALIQVGRNRILFPITVDSFGNDFIELIPIKAVAGYMRGYADPEYIEDLPRMNLPFVPVGKHRAFPIKGDSMPPLQDGSFVVGKFVEDLKDIKDGNTYIILTKDEGLIYKRVYKDKFKADTLMMHSDNPKYLPYPIKINDTLEIWEFTCSMNTKDYKPEELNHTSILDMLKKLQVQVESLDKK
jgi:transcriptional regulator with XRE-family HTH domain